MKEGKSEITMLNQGHYLNQLEKVIEELIEYKCENEDCGYKMVHINRCQKYIKHYLKHLSKLKTPTDQAILKIVRKLVIKLNQLNASTDYALIETDAREAIYEIIQASALACGLTNKNEDITEEWREW